MDLACDTVTMDNTQTENLQQFNLKFQRDINRLTDSDRSSRKRGLQNLVDTLPWNRKTDIEQFLLLNLQTIISLIADPVEKCRELSIKIFIKIFDNNIVLTSIQLQNIIEAVCQRINKIPFPEPSEEIRFQIIELIRLFTSDSYFHLLQSSDTSRTFIFGALTKALHDNFPNSKRSAAEAIIDFAMKFPFVIRMNPGPVMTSLLANGLHQHSKTRVITLKVFSL